MLLTIILLIVVALLLLQLAVHGAIVRQFAHWAGLDPITFRRAVWIAVCINGIGLLFSVLTIYLESRSTTSSALMFGLLASQIVLVCAVSIRMLHASIGRGVMVGLGSALIAGTISLTMAFGVRKALSEAFIVPTGSMAPTIIGHHLNVNCDNCGYPFAVGARSDEGPGSLMRMPPVDCPLCGKSLPVNQLPLQKGDRILAFKHMEPLRWDVAVFYSPDDPTVKHVQRIVGLPGETIEIIHGDLFADGQRLVKSPNQVADLWTLVHDTRYVATNVAATGSRWTANGSEWQPVATGFKCAAEGIDSALLRFVGPTSAVPYNSPRFTSNDAVVHDLRLEFALKKFEGAGSLQLAMTTSERTIIATVAHDGSVTLAQKSTDISLNSMSADAISEHGQLGGTLASLAKRRLILAIRDGVATVLMDDNEVVRIALDDGSSIAATRRKETEPTTLKIAASDCLVEIEGLTVFRDVYYYGVDDLGTSKSVVNRAGLFKLGANEYFVMGDNSAASKDSRFYGGVKRSAITEIARVRYWPPSRWHEFQ